MRYIALLVVVLSISACKKDPRTTVYTMDTYNNSGITGTVTFIEQVGKDEITVRLQADGMKKDTVYLSHLHEGTPGNLIDTYIYFNDLQTSTGSVTRDETWNRSYDEAISLPLALPCIPRNFLVTILSDMYWLVARVLMENRLLIH